MEESGIGDSTARRRVDAAKAELRGAEAKAADRWQVEPLKTGTTLGGQFRIEGPLGEGGMGTVYEGFDTELERPVAIKVMAAAGDDTREHQLVRQEAVLLARLQHPNIVAIHEVAEEGRLRYIVMDRVDGKALDEVIEYAARAVGAEGGEHPRRGELMSEAIGLPLPPGRDSLLEGGDWFDVQARIMLEVARTVEAAHAEGVVHRDLKPRNIMLRGDGSPVVLDFGLAGAKDRDTSWIRSRLVGSVAYMAPEQVNSGQTGSDPRSDVYQLGLMLYEMLTLQRAYPGRQMSAVLENIQRGRFEQPRLVDRGVPADLSAICLKAMAVNPSRRYGDAGALRADLECFVTGAGRPQAAAGGPLGALGRTARRLFRRR